MHDHDHDHVHDHDHDQHHHEHPHRADPEAAQLGPSDDGTVMMDIGGDIGSLVIMASEQWHRAEIEVSPVGQDDRRTHIAIRERRGPQGSMWAGVFPGLVAGDYTVWNLDGTPRQTVHVVGDEVAQIDWS